MKTELEEDQEAVLVSNLIWEKLVQEGIVSRIRTETCSAGTIIRVQLPPLPPEEIKRIENFCSQYRKSYWDFMNDVRVDDNVREDVPQVNFIYYETVFKKR